MRVLTIDDEAKAKVAAVVAHAEKHPYYPSQTTLAPGDDPKFVAKLDTFTAVFTFTHDEGKVYRHLTVSVPGKKYPHPIAAFTIARLFGFTGWDEKMGDMPPDRWIAGPHCVDRCVVILEPVEVGHG